LKCWLSSSPRLLPGKVPADLLPVLLGRATSENLHPVNEFQGYWLVNLLRILTPKAPASLVHQSWLRETSCFLTVWGGVRPFCNKPLAKIRQQWQWGRLHQATFQHALGRVATLEPIFNVGPMAVPGDGNTVAQAGMRPGSYTCCAISVSSRLIVDMSAIEKAEAILAPGQSGHLGSPHYADLTPLWLEGTNFPILWHETDVIAGTQQLLTLTKWL
jgi:acyl-homoserine lactone acylase PvdQ